MHMHVCVCMHTGMGALLCMHTWKPEEVHWGLCVCVNCFFLHLTLLRQGLHEPRAHPFV